MELRDAAQYIRDTVSMDTVLGLYGYKTRHGFMACPFHVGDHTASLKVYPNGKGWYCYGCGRGGSVIDFVMEHDGCSFPIAVKALDGALGLALTDPEDPFETEHRRHTEAILDALEELMIDQIDDKEKELEIRIRIKGPKLTELVSIPKKDRSADQWTEFLNLKDEMEYMEDQKVRCDDMREEVKQWRREHRRRNSSKQRAR